MNQIDLSNRNAIITGGARGIGYAIAERYLKSGAQVMLWDIDTEALSKAQSQLASLGPVRTCAVNLTQESSIKEALELTLAQLGSVDIFVNNAGIAGPNKKVWEYPVADFQQVIDLNLIGVFMCCRAIVPHMMSQSYGRIVNIASVAGKEGNPNASAYSASKAGVIALTKSLGKELAQNNIMVNAITPAAAETDIFKQLTPEFIGYMKSKIPMNRFVLVDEIAAMAAWLASEDCSFSTGAVFDITGGRSTY
ncbi:MAG: 3-oxoacyl-ACP reductase [Pseudomonadota bacterium]|jgi:3-oxoacyl-[acyl-carrier protein] reductase